jgi:hypothetical protein
MTRKNALLLAADVLVHPVVTDYSAQAFDSPWLVLVMLLLATFARRMAARL